MRASERDSSVDKGKEVLYIANKKEPLCVLLNREVHHHTFGEASW